MAETPVKATGKSDEAPKERTDQNEEYSLHVKKEFVLEERARSLPPLPSVEERSSESSGKNKKKKRPRDARIAVSDKACLAIMRGETCSYGDSCRFNHDLKEVMASRPPDIELEGGCPNYKVGGFCPFGAICRLGTSHLNMATGENLRRDADSTAPKPLNVLSRDVQTKLRKKKYPFKTKRYNEQKEPKKATSEAYMEEKKEDVAKKGEEGAAVDGETQVNLSPLPTKRKIIDFSNKVYVAPLTTVGNLPFRRVMKCFGADITCGEMALASNLLSGQSSEWALLKRHPDEDVFGVQIAAAYPDMYTRCAEVIEAEMEFDFMDINAGCPLDMVCHKGAGASLMMRDNRLKGALKGITETISCPVTLKMRTGWDMSKPFAHELVPKIQGWQIEGVGAIMMHGRSRLQRYSKTADWDYISRAAIAQDPSLPRIPVIGNGDIFSYTDFEEKKTREAISSCAMLARGALIKPWLPTEIKEKRHWDISASERLDILKDFVRFGLEHWGSDQQGVNNCRRFLLEWLSFTCRYVPVGLLEVLPQQMNMRPPAFMCGRSDLETLMLSDQSSDWVKLSEMLLGKVPDGFQFEPKHKSKGYK